MLSNGNTSTMTSFRPSASDADHTRRAPLHGRLLVAVFGSACAACSLVACDDPTDPEALAALAADEASEDEDAASDAAEGFMLDPVLVAEDSEPAASGFGVVKLAAPKSYCGQAPTTCNAPPSRDWCTTYAWLADSVGVPKTYRDIMQAKCKANVNGACYECWDLQNYCVQTNTNGTTAVCSGLWARCACMAAALGEPLTY